MGQRLSDSTILNDYPVATAVRFASASNPSQAMSQPTAITDSSDGYWDELERIGVAKSTPEAIPDQLIPISAVRELFDARKIGGIVLERIQWHVYDVKRTSGVISTGIQNADVLTSITTSIGTQNNVYAQSVGLHAIPVDWQPNWFTPRVVVNGKAVEGTIVNTFHAGHRGYASIGSTTGDYEREYAIYFRSIESLELYARCAQRIRTAGGAILYQPYAVMATVIFRTHW